MITCQKCHSEAPESSRFCSVCGTPLPAPVEVATVAMPQSGATPVSVSRVHATNVPGRRARFGPGTMVAGRYQIIGLIGKGGMGEVYRANDLTLDQDVALKFLPENMTGNAAMLARFHGEVRIARQVSHPNVCRVYDIGEVDGQLFLSMEYVDGEDLGSLLRRIGRLPADKAVEFARKICAGLAAAHDKGVLHRDLKPANIMVDSQGRVVVMDFGLAAVSDQVHGLEIQAGTPAYMSPEQLSGHEVTVRSDIYALGLVLYEMFTGKRPFEGNSLVELMDRQKRPDLLSMTTLVRDVDPAVESVIVRCLSPDPKRRPGSALSVSAGLPGGDPLAAALAAGDTPSPELVAASGKTSGIRPLWAIAGAAFVVLGLLAAALTAPPIRTLTVAPMPLPPEVLEFKAQETVRSLGYTEQPVGTAHGFLYDFDYIRYLREQRSKPGRWKHLERAQPAAIVYWYRQSPRYLEPYSDRGGVSFADPPERLTGMASLQMDTRGRLLAFQAVPPQLEEGEPSEGKADWSPAFAAAGLDLSKLKAVEPRWTPLVAMDERAAWEGVWPEAPDQPLRVEAAAWRGRVVYFDTIGPWTRPARMQRAPATRAERTLMAILVFFAVALLCGAVLLARFNLKRGRGDARGALRIGAAGFLIVLAGWALNTHYVPSMNQIPRTFAAIGWALFMGGVVWVGYIALEPYVRRHWPGAIISWTRLLAGGFRDPLVGRDVLAGVVFGLFWGLLVIANSYLELEQSGPSEQIVLGSIMNLQRTIGASISVITGALVQMLITFFLIFVMRTILRREWLAAAGFVVLFTAINAAASNAPLIEVPIAFVLACAMYFAITKFGLITFVVAVYVNTLLLLMPITLDFSAWYSGASVFVLVVVLALAAYGIHTARAGHGVESEV